MRPITRPIMHLIVAMSCLVLGACATTAPVASTQATPPKAAAPQKPTQQVKVPVKSEVPLSALGTDFLYLAAEDAIQQGQIDLATRFFQALVKKDKTAIIPRIQLGGLLLHQGRSKEALELLKTALKQKDKLSPEIAETTHLLYARALVATGQQEKAVIELRKVLAGDPDRLHIRMMEIRLLAGMGHYNDALKVIRAGIKRGDDPNLRQIQAEIYIQQNKLKKAETALKQMQKLAPDSEAVVLMLSQLAARQHDMVKAEYVLRQFLKGHSSALRVGNALGRLMVQENRTKEAIKIYQGIAAKTGGNPGVLSALGLLYYQEKMYNKAVATFEQILEKDPDAPVRFYLAASLEADGQTKRATRVYAEVAADAADYPAAQLQLAGMDFRGNRPELAAKRLLGLIKTHPEYAAAYDMLSSIRASQKKYTLLLKESEPALTLQEVSNNLLFNRAVAFEALKQYDDAESSLRLILSRNPEHSEALNFLGYMFAERGVKLDEAAALVKRALAKRPNDGYYLDSLAWVYFKQGNYAHALKVQQKAVTVVPDDATMQEHLGDILWKHGDTEKAKRAWSRAIKLNQDKKVEARLKRKLVKGL